MTLPADVIAGVQARLQSPRGARTSLERLVAALIREHLAERRAARQQLAAALLDRYYPVVRATAARHFSRCRGAVPLEELLSHASEEALKGALKFDATRKNPVTGQPVSPAPYLRRWADFGCRALLRERLGDQQEVRPDQDEDGSRWERLGGTDEGLEHAPERAAQRAVLLAWAEKLRGPQRRLARLLLQGLHDDEIVSRTGAALQDLDQVRGALAARLRAQDLDQAEDDLVTPVEAAQAAGLEVKVLYKALSAGRLPGCKRDGGWLLRASDVRALVRQRQGGS